MDQVAPKRARGRERNGRVDQVGESLAFRVQPAGGTAGAPLDPAIQVEVRDAAGNVVATATDAITLSAGTGPDGAGLSGTVTVNAVNGVATFSGIVLERAAAGYTLAASGGGLAAATSEAFDIAAAAPTRLGFGAVPPDATAGDTLAVQVQVQDAYGNVVPDGAGRVTITLGAGPADAAIAGTLEMDAAGGVADFGDLVLTTAGSYTLRASAEGLDPGESAAFTISPGAPARLAFVETPTEAAGAVPFTTRVAIQDTYGNTVPGATDSVSVELWINTSGGILTGSTRAAAAAGEATFSTLAVDRPGDYSLRATAAGLSPGFSERFAVTVAFSSVLAGASHTCALAGGGRIYCWGSNASSQLGTGARGASSTLSPVLASSTGAFRALAVGASHNCAITTGGTAACWGSNASGQLGVSGVTQNSVPRTVLPGRQVIAIAAGDAHSCAITSDFETYCWGANGAGQLGISSSSSSYTPTPVAQR